MPRDRDRLVGWVDRHDAKAPGVRTGRNAGPLTRLLRPVADVLVITAGFTLSVGGVEVRPDHHQRRLWGASRHLGFPLPGGDLVVVGKTPGKALIGLGVVTAEGNPGLQARQAILRVLSFPLSLILFLGLVGIVFGRERRAWHDRIAGTAVAYDWGSRTVTLSTPLAHFLERRQRATGETAVADPTVT